MPQYSYTPLEHQGDIRLVTILESVGGDSISITISIASLRDQCRYQALSYCWGEAGRSVPITVRGTNSGTILVTPNLHVALQHARRLRRKVLWIDSISLNQEDEQEKKQQIRRMAEIYRRAESVLIWLGPASEQSDLAMKLIREMPVGGFDEFVKDKHRGDDWKALADLLRRKWFTRRWIIQEVAFARHAELWCGDAHVSWDKFAVAVSLFETQLDNIEELFRRLKRGEERNNMAKQIAVNSGIAAGLGAVAVGLAVGAAALRQKVPSSLWPGITNGVRAASQSIKVDFENVAQTFDKHHWENMYSLGRVRGVGAHSLVMNLDRIIRKDPQGRHYPQKLCSMEMLLYYLPTFRAKEGQDVIFCITSLANSPLGLESNYSNDDNAPTEISKLAVEAIVDKSKSLNIICRPWAGVPEDAPSWLPRLSNYPFDSNADGVYVRVHADGLVGPPDRRVYNASNFKPPSVAFYSDGNKSVLDAAGVRLGKITALAEPASSAAIPKSWLEMMDPKFRNFPAMSDSIKTAFSRILTADRDESGNPSPPWIGKACEELFADQCTLDVQMLLESAALGVEGPIDKSKKAIRKALDVPDGESNFIADSKRWLGKLVEDPSRLPEVSGRTREFLKRVEAATWNRRLARLDNGMVALVPETTRANDSVCILYGCDVPLVLHRVAADQWEMVGEAYVHGVMDGEAIDSSLTLAETRFRIQ